MQINSILIRFSGKLISIKSLNKTISRFCNDNKLGYYVRICISVLILYAPFLPFRLKLKYASLTSIPFLQTSLFENLYRININRFTANQIELLYKSSSPSFSDVLLVTWLIASQKNNIDLVNYFIAFIEDLDFSSLKLLQHRYAIIHPFVSLGDYKSGDQLLISSRDKLNRLLDRQPGFHDESSHFTAIGHMSLFVYVIQAAEIGQLDANNLPFTFKYCRDYICNSLFADLILKYASENNISVSSSKRESRFDHDDDHEIEVWPGNSDSSVLARNEYHKLALNWSSEKKHSPLTFPSNLKTSAESLLEENLSAPWFVGIHIRAATDVERTLRNTSLENAKYICSLVKSAGGQPFLIGANHIISRKMSGHAIDIKSLSSSQFEYELLQLYIWSFSRFFVGSLSGGTNPPALFGTPTIWLDFHPSTHFFAPNTFDIFLPRKIYSKSLSRYLSFPEYSSNEHRFCQTENPLYSSFFGYKVLPASRSCINRAFNHMLEKTDRENSSFDDSFFHPLARRIFL